MLCNYVFHKEQKSLTIPKRQLEILNRRNTDNTMTKKEKGQRDKQRSTKHYTKLLIEQHEPLTISKITIIWDHLNVLTTVDTAYKND